MGSTIVGLGEILWDVLPSGNQMGGAPANFAYFSQQIGKLKSTVVSCIGEDVLGQQIISDLELISVNSNYIAVDKYHSTGKVLVEIDDKGDHSFTVEENAAWDFIPETPSIKKLSEQTDVVCFGSLAQRSVISRTTIRAFLRNMPSGSLRIFDVNLRHSFYTKDVIEISLELSNILKVNDYELHIISKLLSITGTDETVLRELADSYNLRLIILTRGEKGSVLYSNDQKMFFSHPGFTVDLIDSVGAGDAFTASVAVGMLKGYDFNYINDYANRVAAFVCSQSGATPKLTDEIKFFFKG